VKTGVQSIAKALKTLDFGFRRNDVKRNQVDFFTPSLLRGNRAMIPAGRPHNRSRRSADFLRDHQIWKTLKK
jgi:hypothetical protein